MYLPGESHGQRSLAGYSTWGHKEWNMTEQLSIAQHILQMGFPGGTSGEESAAKATNMDLIP